MAKRIWYSLSFMLLSSNAFARGSLAHVEWKTIVALIFGCMVASIAIAFGASSSKDKSIAFLWGIGFGLLLVVIALFTASPELGFLFIALCVAYFYYKQNSKKRLIPDKNSEPPTPAAPQDFKSTHQSGAPNLNHGWGQINRRPKSALEESASFGSLNAAERSEAMQSPAPVDSWPYVQQDEVSNRNENQEALRNLLIAQMKRNSTGKN